MSSMMSIGLNMIHAEILIRLVIVAVFVVQVVWWLIITINQRNKKRKTKKKIREKEERKRRAQEQHTKKSTDDEPVDVAEKFAGLVKPDAVPDEDISMLTDSCDQEILVETIEIEQDTPNEGEKEEKKKKKPSSDTVLEQKKVFKHQDELDRLRVEALRAKEKNQTDLYEKKLIEGLSLEPEYPEFLTMLADHYFHINQYKKALTLLKRLLDHDKENHRAMRQMGEIYLTHGDIKTAEIMIEKAVKHQQNNPRYLYSLVDIKYNSDKVEDAIYLMERILKLRPTNIEYLIATAMLYEKAEQPDVAKRYYATVLEYDSDNHTAKHKMNILP